MILFAAFIRRLLLSLDDAAFIAELRCRFAIMLIAYLLSSFTFSFYAARLRHADKDVFIDDFRCLRY